MGDDRKAGELDIKYHIPSIRYQIQDYRGQNPLIIFAVLVAVSKLSKIFIDIVDTFQRLCVCVFIPSPVRVGTLLLGVQHFLEILQTYPPPRGLQVFLNRASGNVQILHLILKAQLLEKFCCRRNIQKFHLTEMVEIICHQTLCCYLFQFSVMMDLVILLLE